MKIQPEILFSRGRHAQYNCTEGWAERERVREDSEDDSFISWPISNMRRRTFTHFSVQRVILERAPHTPVDEPRDLKMGWPPPPVTNVCGGMCVDVYNIFNTIRKIGK